MATGLQGQQEGLPRSAERNLARTKVFDLLVGQRGHDMRGCPRLIVVLSFVEHRASVGEAVGRSAKYARLLECRTDSRRTSSQVRLLSNKAWSKRVTAQRNALHPIELTSLHTKRHSGSSSAS